MLGRLFGSFSRKKRLARARLADDVLRRLEADNVLIVEQGVPESFGVKRKEFFQTVYDLVMKERIYMISDIEGKVVLMTNAEFSNFMMRRSTSRETEIRRRDTVPAKKDNVALVVSFDETPQKPAPHRSDTAAGDEDDILCRETESTLFTGATLGGAILDGILADIHDPADNRADEPVLAGSVAGTGDSGVSPDLNWFSLDVAASEKDGENLPEGRQSLPERRREPWEVLENAEIIAE